MSVFVVSVNRNYSNCFNLFQIRHSATEPSDEIMGQMINERIDKVNVIGELNIHNKISIHSVHWYYYYQTSPIKDISNVSADVTSTYIWTLTDDTSHIKWYLKHFAQYFAQYQVLYRKMSRTMCSFGFRCPCNDLVIQFHWIHPHSTVKKTFNCKQVLSHLNLKYQ